MIPTLKERVNAAQTLAGRAKPGYLNFLQFVGYEEFHAYVALITELWEALQAAEAEIDAARDKP